MTNTARINTLKADVRRMAVWVKTHTAPGKILEWGGIRIIYIENDSLVSMFSAKQSLDHVLGAGMMSYLVSGKSGAGKLTNKMRREMIEFTRKFPAMPLPR